MWHLIDSWHVSTPSTVSDRRLLVAALLAGVAVTAVFSSVYIGVLLLSPADVAMPSGGGAVGLAMAVLGTWLTELVWSVPYLLVVLRFVAEPSRENALSGAVIIYAVGLLLAWFSTQTLGTETTLATTVRPLGNVASYLAVAAVVWLAYHGGVERLAEALDDPPEHPITALGEDTQLTPTLTVQRALVAAVAGALVGVGGRALTGMVYDQVRAATADGPTVSLTGVGVGVEQFPAEVGFTAAFLLAVLLVTGPRLSRRSVLTALGLLVGVQVAVVLLWALVVPGLQLLPPGGRLMRPVAATSTLLAIAAAVWLAFHDGIERVTG